VANDAFLRQSYDVYAGVEEQFGQALEESLDPSGPGLLYDLVAGFGLPAGAAALDVGCGEGDDAIELARRFGLTVRGIDPVPRHIGIARAELARQLRHRARRLPVAHLPDDRETERPHLPAVRTGTRLTCSYLK